MAKNQLIFERIGDQHLEPFGISSSQMRVLMLIGSLDSPTVSQIALRLGSHPAATVRTLDRLEKKGWIKRHRSTEDRRVVHLSVTAKSKELLTELPSCLCDFLNRSLDGVSEDEFKTVKKVLGMIANNNLKMLDEFQVEK